MIALCRAQYKFHTERAERLAAQIRQIEDAERAERLAAQEGNEDSSISNFKYNNASDPKESIRSKFQDHRRSAHQLWFLSTHVKADEAYQLDQHDLLYLGIGRTTNWQIP